MTDRAKNKKTLRPKSTQHGRPFRQKSAHIRRKTRRANVGAIGAGTIAILLANAIGVAEMAVGALAAYVTYRVIRYGVSPTEAIVEGVELEHGELPKIPTHAA